MRIGQTVARLILSPSVSACNAKKDGSRLNMRARHTAYRPLRVGHWVRVRDWTDIAPTLDDEGTCEGLPFMAEMSRFCGTTQRVCKRAERTRVDGAGMAWLSGTLHLHGVRCDGSAHSDCARGCLLFWKEQWLERLGEREAKLDRTHGTLSGNCRMRCGLHTGASLCQSASLIHISSPLRWWTLKQYVHDLDCGNARPHQLAFALSFGALNRLWRLCSKHEYRQLIGQEALTPTDSLRLRSGEWVRVKCAREIRCTLDTNGRNRGLQFMPEMRSFCGRRLQVHRPVRTFISDVTGKVHSMANTVTLANAVCDGARRRNCPRGCYFLWREVWLRRENGSVGTACSE